MKFIPLENTSNERITISQVRAADGRPFSVDPGKERLVTAAALNHPAVKRFLGAGLQIKEEGAEAPPAPKKAVPAPTPPKPKAQPKAKPKPEPEPEPEEEEEEEIDLRDFYLSAPGITENNVDDVLDAFPSFEELAEADKDDLVDAGVSKSFVSRLFDWIEEESA